MIVVTHRIAGIIFRTESNARLPRLLGYPFDQFYANDIKPDIRQYIYKISLDPVSLSPLSEEERQNLSRYPYFSPDWLNNPILRSQDVRNRLKDFPDLLDELEIWVNEHLVLIRDFSRNQLDIYYTEELGEYVPERQAYMPEYHLAANFREIFSSFLPHFSAILLHSSGVIRGDRAALFLGPNEGGKTTIVKHSNGEPILSGDQIIVRKEGDVIAAHGTPLGGMTSGSCQARVGGLFILEKASHFHLEPIEAPELVQCLWTEHQNNTFFLPQRLKKRAFQILSDVCHKVPVYRMRFPKDYVDWDAIDAAMEGKIANQE